MFEYTVPVFGSKTGTVQRYSQFPTDCLCIGQIRDTANYDIPDSIAGETKAIIEALKARG